METFESDSGFGLKSPDPQVLHNFLKPMKPALFILFLLLSTSAPARERFPIGVIQGEEPAPLRTQPVSENTVAARLEPTHQALAVKKQGDWYEIQTGKFRGYFLPAGLVILDQAKYPIGKILKTGVRIRAIAALDGKIVATLKQGDLLAVDLQGQWYEIMDGEYVGGYISRDYVQLEK